MKRTQSIRTMIAIGVFSALLVLAVAQQSALTTLGIKEAGARQDVVSSLEDGRVPVYEAAKAFKSMNAAMRVKVVQGVLAWAKAYTESPAFKADYEKQREADKPSGPQKKGTVDDQMSKESAERRKQLEEMKKNVANMSGEMRKQMETVVKQMEAQFAKMDADPKMQAMMRQGAEMQRAEEEKSYQERLRAHSQKFPADPKALIARRLQQFLDVSKDVDFGAQLFPQGGKKEFTDTRYRGKSDEWKLCFRAGKESVEAARAFAAAWLKEIAPAAK